MSNKSAVQHVTSCTEYISEQLAYLSLFSLGTWRRSQRLESVFFQHTQHTRMLGLHASATRTRSVDISLSKTSSISNSVLCQPVPNVDHLNVFYVFFTKPNLSTVNHFLMAKDRASFFIDYIKTVRKCILSDVRLSVIRVLCPRAWNHRLPD